MPVAKLTALYRAAMGEEPPPALDDSIRAAARRAVSSRPQRVSSPFIRSWRVPLSIAAVMLLTVSLVTVIREEAPPSRPVRADEAAISTPGSVPVSAAAAGPVAQPLVSPPASQVAGMIQPRTDLPPNKWLERIEELRKQGRLGEAKTSLAEFRKRYPDYELPASLKDWAEP